MLIFIFCKDAEGVEDDKVRPADKISNQRSDTESMSLQTLSSSEPPGLTCIIDKETVQPDPGE